MRVKDFDGEIEDRDASRYLIYGYMGRVYGIPDTILYLAVSYAQLQAGTAKMNCLSNFLYITWGDDPIDQLNIQRGINHWTKLHLITDKMGGCNNNE